MTEFNRKSEAVRYALMLMRKRDGLEEAIAEQSTKFSKSGKPRKLTGYEKVMGLALCLDLERVEKQITALKGMLDRNELTVKLPD